MSIPLLSTRWNNLPTIGLTVIGLTSPGLSVPCFFGIQVTIPFFSTFGGHPLNSHAMCHSCGHVFWSYFVQVTIFHSVKTRSRILQVLQSLNDFIRKNSDGNLRILDLIPEKDQSIVSDTAPLDEVHTSKVQKYDDKDIQIWMTNNSPGEFPPPKVYVTAFVCNWRGVISSKSYSSWHGLGFSRSMLMNLSTTVLSGTYLTWKHHKRRTIKRWRKRVGL